MGCSAPHVSIYVVPSDACRPTNGRSIDGKASKKVDDPRGKPVIKIMMCHGAPVFIASDFSSRATSRDISKFRAQKRRPESTRSQRLHPGPTISDQTSGN